MVEQGVGSSVEQWVSHEHMKNLILLIVRGQEGYHDLYKRKGVLTMDMVRSPQEIFLVPPMRV